MKKDSIKFILFVISLVVFLIGVIINNESMVYYSYFFTMLVLVSLDEDQFFLIMDSYRGIPFIIIMIIFFIGCVLHKHRLVAAASSAIMFLNLRVSRENEEK